MERVLVACSVSTPNDQGSASTGKEGVGTISPANKKRIAMSSLTAAVLLVLMVKDCCRPIEKAPAQHSFYAHHWRVRAQNVTGI